MRAFVIKRNDGKYLSKYHKYDARKAPVCEICFTENLLNAHFYRDDDLARHVKNALTDFRKLKVVRVEIEEKEMKSE